MMELTSLTTLTQTDKAGNQKVIKKNYKVRFWVLKELIKSVSECIGFKGKQPFKYKKRCEVSVQDMGIITVEGTPEDIVKEIEQTTNRKISGYGKRKTNGTREDNNSSKDIS